MTRRRTSGYPLNVWPDGSVFANGRPEFTNPQGIADQRGTVFAMVGTLVPVPVLALINGIGGVTPATQFAPVGGVDAAPGIKLIPAQAGS